MRFSYFNYKTKEVLNAKTSSRATDVLAIW